MGAIGTESLAPLAAADPERALYCAPAPPEGDLDSNGTGWLLARGSLDQRLVDPPSEVRTFVAATAGVLLAASFEAVFHRVLAIGVAVVPFMAFHHVRRIRLRRKLARLEAL